VRCAGACLAMLKGLITIDGVCSFANTGLTAADFANIPYLVFRGWYPSAISNGCDGTVAAIKAAAERRTSIKLDDPSFGTRFSGRHSHDDDEHEESRGLRRDPEMGGQNIKNPPAGVVARTETIGRWAQEVAINRRSLCEIINSRESLISAGRRSRPLRSHECIRSAISDGTQII